MNFIVGILAAAKGLALLTGLIVLNTSTASVSPTAVTVDGGFVRITCVVEDAYPRELEDLARTGTDIPLYVVVAIHGDDRDEPLGESTSRSRLVYDMVEQVYRVEFGVGGQGRVYGTLDSAIAASSTFERIALVPIGRIDSTSTYVVTVQAVLGKTSVEALENNRIDLMYYWNYKRPVARTQPIEGRALLGLHRPVETNRPDNIPR